MTEFASVCLQQIADCEARESRLTEWDGQFLDSIKHQLEAGKGLSPKQIEKLDEIWDRATTRG